MILVTCAILDESQKNGCDTPSAVASRKVLRDIGVFLELGCYTASIAQNVNIHENLPLQSCSSHHGVLQGAAVRGAQCYLPVKGTCEAPLDLRKICTTNCTKNPSENSLAQQSSTPLH